MPRLRITPLVLASAAVAAVAAAPLAAQPSPATSVTLFGTGIQLTTIPGEDISQVHFGDPFAAAERRLTSALGAPARRVVRRDCAADALVVSRFPGGLRLVGRGGRLAGWVLTGPGPLVTVDGVGIGASPARVRAAWPGARARRTPRGTVLVGATARSLQGGRGGAATVIWSGTACIPGVAAVPQEADFAAGTPGTDGYEALSFLRSDGDALRVVRTTGADRAEETATALPSAAGLLRLRLAGGIVVVTRSGAALRVEGPGTAAARNLRWEYRGPVDGVGTACADCLDRGDALPFVLRNFLDGRSPG